VALWFVGFVGVAAGFVRAQGRLRRSLGDLAPVQRPDVLDLAQECHRRMGVGRVDLYQTSGVATPAVYGFVRPKILVPRQLIDRLGEADWRNVLCHELAHVRRGDLVLQAAGALALAVHWFNPLVWLAWRGLLSDTELACDRAVLDRLAEVDRPRYGHTLLNLASQRPAFLPWTPALAPWGTPHHVWKRRILMIASHRVEPLWKKGLSGFLVLALGVVGLTHAQPLPPSQANPGSLSEVTLTVVPGDHPRRPSGLSPTGFLKAKIYELSVSGAQSFTLNGRPLGPDSVLTDRDGAVVLDGGTLAPPWVLHAWAEGRAVAEGQELSRAAKDGVAEWAGLTWSTAVGGGTPPAGALTPLPLAVYQPAELSFGLPETAPAPKATGSPWVEVKGSNTVVWAPVSTVAEAQALVPWTLALPSALPSGYLPTPAIGVFKDKWGHFFSSMSFRPAAAPPGAQLLLLETDLTGWAPKPGPWQQATAVGNNRGHWRWAWSEFGTIGDDPVAVRATELSWTKDRRAFLLVDSTGLTKRALVEIASSIP